MFQTGGLIVFCGLLALPLPVHLAPDSTDLAGRLTGALSDGLLSGGLLDTVKNLPVLDILKTDGDTSDGLVGRLLQQVINPLNDLTGIEITRPKLLEFGAVPSEDGHRLYLNIPLSFNLNVRVPIVKQHLLMLSVKLNITLETFPEIDEDGVHLVGGECSHSPGELEISLLNGSETLLTQRLINSLTDTLSKAVPKLLQGEVCSIINELLSRLDVSLVHGIIEKLLSESNIIIIV